jgi:hypothetical protein
VLRAGTYAKDMPPVRLATVAVLGLRAAYGAALVFAPGRVTKQWLGPAATRPPAVVGVRGLGAREVAVHVAALVDAVRGAPLRPWLALSMSGDLFDIAATAAARAGLPDKAAVKTAAVAGGSAALSAALALVVDRDS